MANQTSLDNDDVNWSLSGLEKQLKNDKNAKIKNQTIEITFSSPEGFVTYWTIYNAETKKEYENSLDEGVEYSKRRLMGGWVKRHVPDKEKDKPLDVLISNHPHLKDEFNEDAWNDILNTQDTDLTPKVLEFLEKKEQIPELKKAIKETRNVYSQVPRNRRISIGQRMNNITNSVDQYKENIDKVDENIQFEKNAGIAQGGEGSFQNGKQATTGHLKWYNRQGEQRAFIIFSNKVKLKPSRSSSRVYRTFDNKQKALRYYRNHRLA